MKTTIEISDQLLRKTREVAAREGVTLRALVERGLYRVVAETERSTPFKLRCANFKGKGAAGGISRTVVGVTFAIGSAKIVAELAEG